MSRWKVFLSAIVIAAIGVVVAASEIQSDGFSRAVIWGIIAGVLLDLALAVGVAHNWNRRVTPSERRAARKAWERRRLYVWPSIGVGLVVSAWIGVSGNASTFFYTALSILCLGGAILGAIIAFARRGLLDDGTPPP